MDNRGFMNAISCMQFGVGPFVHISVKKQCFPYFLKHIYNSYMIDSIVLYPFSGNVPFPHSVGLQSTAILLLCDILSTFECPIIGT